MGVSVYDQRFYVAVREALRDWTTGGSIDILNQEYGGAEPSRAMLS